MVVPSRSLTVSSAADADIYAQKIMIGHRQQTKRNTQAIRIISSILFIGIYGLICYQIGAASRSADLQWNEVIETPVARKTTALPAPIDNSQLPHQCGLLFFYHIPSTGGSTINKWLLDYTPKNGGNVKYFTHWGAHHSIGGGEKAQEAFISGNDGGMNEFVKNLEPNEWRIAHCHHNSLHLNETEYLMNRWRTEVEARGCHFVGNVMLRESLSHTLSLYKHLNRYNVTREEWADHLKTSSELGHWATQLDFFLYNNLARNPVSGLCCLCLLLLHTSCVRTFS